MTTSIEGAVPLSSCEVTMHEVNELINKGLKAHWISGEVGFSEAVAIQKAWTIWRKSNPDTVIEFHQLVDLGILPGASLLTVYNALTSYLSARKQKAAEKAVGRTLASAALKATYLPLTTVTARQNEKGGPFCWATDSSVRGSSLMAALFREHHEPVAFPIQCTAIKASENEASEYMETVRAILPLPMRKQLEDRGLVVSQNKTVWNTKAPAWEMLAKIFPNAIEATPYNHSLTAPTYPGGILLDCEIVIKNIVDEQGRLIGADGSGRIHPNHPLVRHLNRPGGKAYVVQWRAVNSNGWFFKGILVPDERCVGPDGSPELWADWKQVKGLWKKDALESREAGDEARFKVSLGIINVWDNPKMRISACFENLENIKTTDRTKELVASLVAENMEKLGKRGIMGLIKDAADESPGVKMAMDIITAMNAKGAKINPLSIPWIRETMRSRLGKTLYRLAQGGGIKYPARVAVIDNSLEPGTCVVSGHEPGKELAVTRIPLVLSQGVLVLKSVVPHSYHLVNGDVVPNTIFLNEHDLVLCMMGDDDGDVVMVSDDARVVELHQNRIEEVPGRLFSIEPAGEKMIIDTASEAGRNYMSIDPRGPVGVMTIRRARMLAVGNYIGALVMSILIQEAIDKAKRFVRWTDYRAAMNLALWMEIDGAYRFDSQNYNMGTELDDKALGTWCKSLLMKATGSTSREFPNVIPWRYSEKKINPETWQPCWIRGNWPSSTWIEGNLVHFCHDTALTEWKKVAKKFEVEGDDVPMECLLFNLMRQTYPDLVLNERMEWETYRNGLRGGTLGRDANPEKKQSATKPTGLQLRAFGETRAAAMNCPDLVERNQRMEGATASLHAHLRNRLVDDKKQLVQDLCQGWFMEVRYAEKANGKHRGNVNNAFYLTSWLGSPVLEVLELDEEKACNFITPAMERKFVSDVLKAASPFEALGEMILRGKRHEVEKGVPISHCDFCLEKAQGAVVRAIRANQGTRMSSYFKDLISSLCGTSPDMGELSIETDWGLPGTDDYEYFE